MLTCLDWRIMWLGIVTTLVFTVGGLGEIIDSPSLWVNYDLSKLDDALISELNRNLLDRGAFLLPGFLSEDFLATLQQEVHGAQTARYEKMRTILQDSGDFSGAFPDDSIRNILFNNSMNFIPRTFFPDDSMIHHFYEGDFFLEFLKLVVGSSEVYRSADYEGSVTGARGTRQDSYSFAWHFDEHPLGCVLMLNNSKSGGAMEYINFRSGKFGEERPWDRIEAFFRGEVEEMSRLGSIAANPSDLYCFLGNTTLHRVTEIGAGYPEYRAIIVMSYAMETGFQHSKAFKETGYWATQEEEEESGREGLLPRVTILGKEDL
mmetsp:Transcript_2144/g.3615  ORF Transcript_2144/g.3615 Transcript_2144/m.3615 type:complete len:319 (+) Transcript_2144:149-1105(+)